MISARKISFEQAWESSVVFLVDEALEREIEKKTQELVETERSQQAAQANPDELAKMLIRQRNGIEVVLKDLELSIEKFMRVISLLRKLGRLPGGFDSEW